MHCLLYFVGYNLIMRLRKFPQFSEVDLSYRDIINEYFRRYPFEASEYTFTNIFAFRFKTAYNFKISQLKDNLIILKDKDPASVFCPVGNSQISDVLNNIFDYLKKDNKVPYMERIPEGFLNVYLKDKRNFMLEADRNQFDYICNVRELIELKGNRFHDKKNRVNKFRKLYKYDYLTLTPDLIGECLEFEDYWCEVRECEKHPGLRKEQCAILAMLKNFRALDIKGGAIRIEGKIAAITLGEKLLPDTFVIHVEKANPDIPGLYQTINQEFLIHEKGDCRFVNRQQDLGIAGLRRAKMSYNPVRFVKKFKVRQKAT